MYDDRTNQGDTTMDKDMIYFFINLTLAIAGALGPILIFA